MRRVLAVLAISGAACSETPPATQLVVVADSSLAVPASLVAVRAELRVPESDLVIASHRFELGSERDVPFSFGVGPRDGDPSLRVLIELAAIGPGSEVPLFTTRATTRFIAGRTLRLSMFLAESCATTSCVAIIDETSLEVIEPGHELDGYLRPDGGVVEEPDAGFEDAHEDVGFDEDARVEDADAGFEDARVEDADVGFEDARVEDAEPSSDAAEPDGTEPDATEPDAMASPDATAPDSGPTYTLSVTTGPFSSITASGMPVAVTDSDDGSGTIMPGIAFPFFGTTLPATTTLYASTNGMLSVATDNTEHVNVPIPGTGVAPDGFIAPFWDDLTVPSGNIYWQTIAGVLIIEWNNVQFYSTPAQLNFQVQINSATGVIELYYGPQSSPPPAGTASIGIESLDGLAGASLACTPACGGGNVPNGTKIVLTPSP